MEDREIEEKWMEETLTELCQLKLASDDLDECRLLANLGKQLFPASSSFLRITCMCLLATGKSEEAEKLLDLSFDGSELPGWANKMHNEIAQFYERRGQLGLAIKHWEKANGADDTDMHSMALVARLKAPETTLEKLYESHDAWAKRFANGVYSEPMPERKRLRTNGKIRVGISCSFWTSQTIRFQFLPWAILLDKSRFEVYAFVNYDDGYRGDPGIDEVRVTAGLSSDEFVEVVRSENIDILIELNGHSPFHRFAAMAMRCAPIQVSYLNYTATCGIDAMDYLVADEIACPVGEEKHYKEKIARIPGCFFCFDYTDDDAAPLPVECPSLRNGYVTFGCFSSGGKINRELVELFAKVLLACPNSRILVKNRELDRAVNRQYLKDLFVEFGVSEHRLMIEPGLDREPLLKEYGRVDISFDTYPYNGGNTIAESMWQGVPVVTLRGSRFSAAYGASLLTASGCKDLISTDCDEFVRISCDLAKDEARRIYLRTHLRTMMYENGFSDSAKFANRFGTLLEDMVEEYEATKSES